MTEDKHYCRMCRAVSRRMAWGEFSYETLYCHCSCLFFCQYNFFFHFFMFSFTTCLSRFKMDVFISIFWHALLPQCHWKFAERLCIVTWGLLLVTFPFLSLFPFILSILSYFSVSISFYFRRLLFCRAKFFLCHYIHCIILFNRNYFHSKVIGADHKPRSQIKKMYIVCLLL